MSIVAMKEPGLCHINLARNVGVFATKSKKSSFRKKRPSTKQVKTMAHIKPDYKSKTTEQALAHLAEELNEAATAVAKSLRFGPLSVNPELPPSQQETNFAWLRREMVDVASAYRVLDGLLASQGHITEGELTGELVVELD